MSSDALHALSPPGPLAWLVILSVSAGLTVLATWALMPLMRRYAMARPTARGLHTAPTPQGGGLPIVLAVAIVCLSFRFFWPPFALPADPVATPLLAGAGLMAALGAADDIVSLGARPRLLAQFVVAAPLAGLTLWAAMSGEDPRSWLAAVAPAGGALFWAIALIASIGLMWFVNLTNFMDGMDGMTVIGLGGPALFAALAHCLGFGDPALGVVCLALVGGLAGFAPFNWPRARLFLGDVGSLSLGLIMGVALLALAARGHVFAALIAPLYYLADSGITLARRAARGENLAQAHRTHFYQRAVTGGMGVPVVLARVGALNIALAALASAALVWPDPRLGLALLFGACAVTGLTLRRLARGA